MSLLVEAYTQHKSIFHANFPFLFLFHLGVGPDLSKSQDEDAGGLIGISSLTAMQKKSGIPVRSTTSGSSRDLSDDYEETATTDHLDPANAKRVRRYYCTFSTCGSFQYIIFFRLSNSATIILSVPKKMASTICSTIQCPK